MNTEMQGTVLVVDDTEAARYAKARLLRAAGFEVLEVGTGREALQVAQDEKPDLVLLDIKLPDIDGFEVCRQLRGNPHTSSLAIVHISASYERPEHQVKGLEGGADTFLLSPIDPSVLVATVRAMIRLRKAENALRESDRRKDEFLAVLAHELRNPLAPLRYSLQLFQHADVQDPLLHTARGIMERQIAQMVRLIDDLLEVSRINQNKLELRREQTTVAQALEAAIETCKPGLEAARHELTVTMPTEPIRLFADRVRLAQVFGNLLSNSTKFTEPGGRITVVVTREGDEAVITVTDSGVGIAPEELTGVFRMFEQARRESEHHGGGMGIGLALARRLVEMHGGTVLAHSAGIGHGSTFVVRLPITDWVDVAPDIVPDIPVAANSRHRKILVVDDNVDSAESLSMLLSSLGHSVHVCHDGLDAVKAAETFRPEIIIMDVSMPRLNGLEATAQIRAQPWSKGVTICAMTGYGQAADRRRSKEAGIDYHLVKPVDPVALVELLSRL